MDRQPPDEGESSGSRRSQTPSNAPKPRDDFGPSETTGEPWRQGVIPHKHEGQGRHHRASTINQPREINNDDPTQIVLRDPGKVPTGEIPPLCNTRKALGESRKTLTQVEYGKARYTPCPRHDGQSLRDEMTLTERLKRPYSFRVEHTVEIYHLAERYYGLQRPPGKHTHKGFYPDHPNSCLYHQVTGHTTKNCWVFKDWVEENLMIGRMVLPSQFLQDPAPHNPALRLNNTETTISIEGTPSESKQKRRRDDLLTPKKTSYESCHMVSVEPETEDYVILTKDAPKELEEGGQNTIDELIEVDLGTKDDPRPTYISASLPAEEKRKLRASSPRICGLFCMELP